MLGAWGTGDALRAALKFSDAGRSRLSGPLISLALGLGVIGEALFLLGVSAPLYRPGMMWTVLVALAILALFRLRAGKRSPNHASGAGPLSLFEAVVIVFVVIYAVRWFWVLSGFTVGSDVFSHHYAQVKYMISVRRFGHAFILPFGRDHISNYNPALMHMLFVPMHMLADERASNLIHWTTQLMLFASLYVLGVQLRSRAAGLLAVGIYLTVGLLGNFPLDVNDYTLTGVYLLLTLHCVFCYAEKTTRAPMYAGALMAGMMTATKYYGLVALPLISILILAVSGARPAARLRSAVVFSSIALLFLAPWALYNFATTGNPIYPIMSGDLMPRLTGAINPVHMVEDFVAPGDHGFLVPQAMQYFAYVIPFSPPDAVFALSGLFLILLPVSLFYVLRRRWGSAREANLLFLCAAALFALIFVVIHRIAFPKWAFFPALIDAVSIALLAQEWSLASRRVLLITVTFMIAMNYAYIGSPYARSFGPHTTSQRERWDEISRYLNDSLPSGTSIAGLQFIHNYYLRSDVNSIEEQPGGFDWPSEEKVLRQARVQYVLTYPGGGDSVRKWYAHLLALWKQLSPDNPSIGFLEDYARRVAIRDAAKAEFLRRTAAPVHQFSDATTLYRLTW